MTYSQQVILPTLVYAMPRSLLFCDIYLKRGTFTYEVAWNNEFVFSV